MDEETAGAETPVVDTAVAVEAPVAISDATTEQPATESAETAPAEPDDGEDTPAPPKKKHWANERIDELTRQRREAERQAEYWKVKASQTVDLDSLEYEDGLAERFAQRNRQDQAATAQESAAHLAQEAFGYRETLAREKFGDYDAVTRSPDLRITPSMAKIIWGSDHGPELAYHLGKNLREAAHIASLSTDTQAYELGQIVARVTAPKAIPKPLPAPVQPVGGNASGGSADPSKMSMSEYMAWRQANP